MSRVPDVTQSLPALSLKQSKIEVHEWSVEVVGGPDKGRKVKTLGSLVSVGTDPTNDLVLTDSTVSRRHLEIERTSRGLLLRDLGSRNGVMLGDHQVLQVFVSPGDKLTLGKTQLKVKQDEKATVVELEGADSFGELVGTSEAMRSVFSELRRAAQEEFNLLIEGETGTGKELAARAVHSASARRHGPFKVVDCNLLGEAVEKELFGVEGEIGIFEEAEHGTVFLDEVGQLSAAAQPKLLRVLDTREVKGRKVDVRIIASTQKNLEEEVRLGNFRSDLYFRLAVGKVKIPPLRTRREDLPVLAPRLLQALGSKVELTPQTLGMFESYDWPGNVRELRNMLERASVMQDTGSTTWLELLPQPKQAPGEKTGKDLFQVLLGLPYHEAKDRVQGDFERVYFAEVMKQAGFDFKAAEARTGLSMQSLYRLLKKNGLRVKDLKNAEGADR